MNNSESLRTQLIMSMQDYVSDQRKAEELFDKALWPVLKAAMKAGELLVARNTVEQKPVSDAILGWLEGVLIVVNRVKADEKTISRAQVLKILFDLERVAQQALTDAKALPY